MPAFNGMGPNGAGPQSGKGFGPCGRDRSTAVYGRGNGFGRGYGRRMGVCRWQQVQFTPQEERQILEGDVKNLEAMLKDARARLDEIDKSQQ